MGGHGSYYAEFEIMSGSATIGVSMATREEVAKQQYAKCTMNVVGVRSDSGHAAGNTSSGAFEGHEPFQQGDKMGLLFSCGWAWKDDEVEAAIRGAFAAFERSSVTKRYLAAGPRSGGCLTVFKNGSRLGVAVPILSNIYHRRARDNAISGYPAEYLWVVQLHAVGSSVRVVNSHGAVPELCSDDRMKALALDFELDVDCGDFRCFAAEAREY
jgi:hypothetical protein